MSESSVIGIANDLADLTGLNSQTITLPASMKLRTKFIYVNSNGERVDKDTEGAVNLITFLNNKNWTVPLYGEHCYIR